MPSHTTTRLVIFACGNPSRGDDALGPELLRHLQASVNLPCIEWIEDFQLQVEHALDLANRDMALFIDASVACTPPFTFTRLYADKDITYTTHALHPSAILYTYESITQQPAPPTFLLSVRGEAFELGTSLSPAAEQHLQAALTLMQRLCTHIEITAWQEIVKQQT